MGTPLERLRVPLSTWVRAAHAFSYERTVTKPLIDLQSEIGVSYRTILRMRDLIRRAAGKYKGHQREFGAWPRSFMKPRSAATDLKRQELLTEGQHPSQHTISSTGVLSGFKERQTTPGALRRTECLLRLLLVTTPKLQRRPSRTNGP